MLFKIIVLAFLTMVCSRKLLPPRWNGLKIRYNIFKNMPRTENEAVAEGFKMSSDCEDNPKFKGKQYLKDNDTMAILLFDKNGYIAGIQTGIPKGLPNNYPRPDLQPMFIDDGELYKVTAYFVDPLLICNKGRSRQQFRLQGTGTDLFIQNGNNPEQDLIEIAQEESQSTWRKGKCKRKMGYHYFLNVTPEMSCDEFAPIYLIYLEGNLKGFIMSFNAVLNSTIVPFENPSPSALGAMLDTTPSCMNEIQRSTLHVYLEDKPEAYTCEDNASTAGCVSVTWITVLIGQLIAIINIL